MPPERTTSPTRSEDISVGAMAPSWSQLARLFAMGLGGWAMLIATIFVITRIV